jgi:O-6-methylguanine DNA methyltransferase
MEALMKKNEPVAISNLQSAIGEIWVAVSERGLVGVEIGGGREAFVRKIGQLGFGEVVFDAQRTTEAARQIGEFLEGKRQSFDLQIDWSGMSPFQQQVLHATFAIPFGQTATYGEIARQIGKPAAARAVGRAEATNPMPLVIPCHRVIGADGGLHGYGAPGGLDTKAWLLRLEKNQA